MMSWDNQPFNPSCFCAICMVFFSFFLTLLKAQLILGNSKSTFNLPNATNFYYMIQISPSFPLPKRDFSADASMPDSGYYGSLTEVCKKCFGRQSGSLGNFTMLVPTYLYLFLFFTFLFLFIVFYFLFMRW